MSVSLEVAALATKHAEKFDRPDEVGAFPIHCLTVCNTPDAIDLVMEMCDLVPTMLTLVHVKHRSGLPLFVGESILHILACNRHEDILVKMIEMIACRLERDQAHAILASQAEGTHLLRLNPADVKPVTSLPKLCDDKLDF